MDGPGSGKSTIAAGLFCKMKTLNYNVELITEFAKDLVYENRELALENQIYIFGKMYHKLYRVENKVDWVVIDSPLLLNSVYKRRNKRLDFIDNTIFDTLIKSVYDSFNNYDICLIRDNDVEFQQAGRVQDLDQSKIIDDQILSALQLHNCKYISILNKKGNIDNTINDILSIIKKEKKI